MDVLELGQLGQQVVGHIRPGALRDVVEHDRQIGGPAHLLVMAYDPAPARPVVVGIDVQERVRTDLGGALGRVDRVAGVVRAHAGHDRALALHLLDGQADEAQVLLVVER